MNGALLFVLLSGSVPAVGAQTTCRAAPTLTPAAALTPPRFGFSAVNAERLAALMQQHGYGAPGYDPCARPLAVVVFEGGLLSSELGSETVALALRNDVLSWGRAAGHLPKVALTETSSPTDGRQAADRLLEVLPSLDEMARRKAVVGMLAELSLQEARTLTQSLLGRELDSALELGRRDNVVALARLLRQNGWDVFFMGWTPQWLMEAVLQSLGLSPNQAIGTRALRSPSGEPTGRLKEAFPSGFDKVIAVRTRIAPGGREPKLVVGYDEDDEALLESAGPSAMVIGNPEMLDRAEASGWMQQ